MCHICGRANADSMVKCKLCCDGLEQDFCVECAQVYDQYRSSCRFVGGVFESDRSKLQLLQVRRNEYVTALKARKV